MKIPGFTAEASLYKKTSSDSSPRRNFSASERAAIIPQLGGEGFKGFAGCQSDCLDQHPEKTREQCRRACVDPFGGADLGTSGDPVNDFLSSAGISFWEAACTANPYSPPGACRWLANRMRES